MPAVSWNEDKNNAETIISMFDTTEIKAPTFTNGILNEEVEKEKNLIVETSNSSPTGIRPIGLAIRTTKVIKKGEKRKSSSFSPILDGNYSHLSNGTEKTKKARFSGGNESDSSMIASCHNLSESSHHVTVQNGGSELSKGKMTSSNEIYQGLLNNVKQNQKESSSSKIKKQLKHITRKDLEDMIIEQFISKILYDHELGQRNELCKRLEATLESANKRALKLTKEVARLKDITEKLAEEHNKRKSQFIIPVKVKRSVGLQVNDSLINESRPGNVTSSKLRQVDPLDNNLSRIGNGEIFPQGSDTTSGKPCSDIYKVGYGGCSSLADLSTSLPTSTSIDRCKRNSDNTSSDAYKNNDEEIIVDSLVVNKVSSCVPLPNMPAQKYNGSSRILPPRPKLKLQQKNKSIVLSWDLSAAHDTKPIASYQLFSYDEGTEKVNEPFIWKKIGSVKALELPMACTLTQFKGGRAYHFAVRAVDVNGTIGPYSVPKVIRMPP